jgi:hypothetical protein
MGGNARDSRERRTLGLRGNLTVSRGVHVDTAFRRSRRSDRLGIGRRGRPRPLSKKFHTFSDFYPFYLSEHANRTSRRLHFTGTSVALVLLIAAIATQKWWLAAVALVQGYAFAWVGHFFFERNKPATFRHPGFSLMGDWRLWWDILTGKQKF